MFIMQNNIRIVAFILLYVLSCEIWADFNFVKLSSDCVYYISKDTQLNPTADLLIVKVSCLF